MNKTIVIFIGIVVVISVVAAIYGFMQSQNRTNNIPIEMPLFGITNSPSPSLTPTESLSNSPSFLPTQSPTASPKPTKTPTPIPGPVSTTHAVTIQGFAFNPSSITVKKGDTIVWTNKDSVSHTVTGDGGLASSNLNTNGTYRFTFNTVGTFNYHCSPHPSMTGTVTVTQ